MGFVLVFIGVALFVSAIQNTQGTLGKNLQADFTGQGNFIYWIVAIAVIGSIGYIDELQDFSRAFLVLVLLALFLSNRGFFATFNQDLSNSFGMNPLGSKLLNLQDFPQTQPGGLNFSNTG